MLSVLTAVCAMRALLLARDGWHQKGHLKTSRIRKSCFTTIDPDCSSTILYCPLIWRKCYMQLALGNRNYLAWGWVDEKTVNIITKILKAILKPDKCLGFYISTWVLLSKIVWHHTSSKIIISSVQFSSQSAVECPSLDVGLSHWPPLDHVFRDYWVSAMPTLIVIHIDTNPVTHLTWFYALYFNGKRTHTRTHTLGCEIHCQYFQYFF